MNQPAAYLFFAIRPTTYPPPGIADSRAAYRSGATAAMQRLGTTMTVLASTASVQAVNGTWGFDHVVIERYSSLSQIHDFWNSAEYTAARPHRQGLVHMHFIAAIPGLYAADDQTGHAAYAIAFGPDIEPTSPAVPLAVADPTDITVLEGSWPFEGRTIIEHHPSTTAAAQAWQEANATTAIVIPAITDAST
ncbi:MAG TPA: DUF1330 domain-containing protein [Streptosporangiaceae bacterium]|nr:DUF1330 domain-containing protein [Streptosporangiaceae bacterium]